MTLLLLDSLREWATSLFENSHYLGPFLVLLLCGIGLPLPEEVTLIGSGILVHQGKVEFLPIVAICSIAILLGDSIPFWIGRHYGMRAIRWPIVRKLLHPERFALLQKRFESHGNWVVFTFRFLPGIRIPGYFMAGTLKMRYPRFLALDMVGVLISVPVSIWLGKVFGSSLEELEGKMESLSLVLGFGVVSLILILYGRHRLRKRELELGRLAAEKALADPNPVAENSDNDGPSQA